MLVKSHASGCSGQCIRQVLLGTAHLACAIRPSCRFAYGRLAPFTFIILTDAGRSLLAQSLHSKVYFYRFWLCRTAFRTASYPRGWVLFFSFLLCPGCGILSGAFRVALQFLILVLRAGPCFLFVSGVRFVCSL